MHIVDIVFLILFAIFAFKGYNDGLAFSVLSVVFLLVSLFVAVLYMAELSDYLTSYLFLLGDSVISVIAFLILFFVSHIVLGFLGNVVKILNKMPIVGSLNKGLGAVFGLIKGMLILSILIFLLNTYKLSTFLEDELQESVSYNYLSEIAPSVYDSFVSLIPIGQKFYDEVNKDVKESIDEQWKDVQTDTLNNKPVI